MNRAPLSTSANKRPTWHVFDVLSFVKLLNMQPYPTMHNMTSCRNRDDTVDFSEIPNEQPLIPKVEITM
jgi:hypothetical protein